MKKASTKDILRTLWKEKKRFISIMMITVLGVTMMTGIEAGCRDLKLSADRFYDSQDLFDICVMSTLGLTQDDVVEIQAMDGVRVAEGSFSEVVHTKNKDVNKTAEMKIYKEGGLNAPYVLEGRLPQAVNEVVVSENYLKETGKQIGDNLIIEEILDESEDDEEKEITLEGINEGKEVAETEENDVTEVSDDEEEINLDMDSEVKLEEETPNFPNTEFVIVGTIIDVMDINNAESSASFRATPNADYTFFVLPEAVESEVYTAVYVSLEGTEELLCYSKQYEDIIESFTERIETEIMEQREIARHKEITDEAYEKIAEKETEMYDTFAEIDQEFEDAWTEISDGWNELNDGKKELADGKIELAEKEQEAKEEIADARKELEDAYEQLNDAWLQLNDAEMQINIGEAELEEGKDLLRQKEKEVHEQLAEAEAKLKEKIAENDALAAKLDSSLTQMKALFGTAWEQEINTGVLDADDNNNPIKMGPISETWNAYVGATTQVISTVIAEQMTVEETMSEDEMQLAIQTAMNAALSVNGGNNNYKLTQSVLASKIANTIEAMQKVNRIKLTPENSSLVSKDEAIQILNGKLLEENLTPEEYSLVSGQLYIMMWDMANDALQKIEGDDTKNFFALATGMSTTNAITHVLNGAMSEFNEQKEYALSQIEAGWAKLAAGELELEEGRQQLSDGRAQVIENYQKWQDGVKELDESEQDALREIADAWAEIAEGEQELIDGEQELIDGEIELKEHELEYQDARTDAEEKIAEAKQEVADIDMTKWYVQDRMSLSGYGNVHSDTSCIESLSTVFTIVFFVVAILISLTTVTRMVEEERGLIGTYKALGFTDGEIRRKYVVYAAGASILGAMLGDIGGFVILPEILFIFFRVMYVIPTYILKFEVVKGTIACLLFIVGIVGAAYVACYSELKHVAAQLMRPKAPKEGSRVFLEYIKPLWKRMSFLNKVTARNLFRYKKRMFMTVFGIMGCTALLLFGLAIKDSVDALMPMQYENVYSYDLLAAASGEDNEKLVSYIEERAEVTEYLNIQVETIKLKNKLKASEKVQLMVLPDGADISKYVSLMNENLKPITIGNKGIYLTENASRILDIHVGDTAYIQKLDLTQEAVQITSLVKNYLGNNIYMSQTAYEEVFGDYEPNGVLVNLADSCTDQIGFADELASEDWILSAVSTQELKETFMDAFILINIVVYVVLVLAACLAFVVLFTLASINISERERELATIKVLGFFDKEVHAYVNKETIILTIMGILIGLPMGAFISSLLTDILNMPSIYFAITIYGRSYWIAAGIAFGFALIVQLLTDRSLDVIDPVEALKSVE